MSPHGKAPIAVFCGSRIGRDPACRQDTAEFGRALAEAGHELVYGGGGRGLMGVLADAALAAGGRVTGVIPGFLQAQEVAHPGLTRLIVTGSMHERKQRMFAHAAAFVALPGGIGTIDELIEIVTWRQLGQHAKPVFVLNAGHWFRGLGAALAAAHEDGFADPPPTLLRVVGTVAELMPLLAPLTLAPAEAARL